VPGRATGRYVNIENNTAAAHLRNKSSSSFKVNNGPISNLAIVEFFYDFAGFLPGRCFFHEILFFVFNN
jgi:hypothetical protein